MLRKSQRDAAHMAALVDKALDVLVQAKKTGNPAKQDE